MPSITALRIGKKYSQGSEYRHDARQIRKGRNMFVEFLTFCRDYDIIETYDKQLIEDLFQNLKEREPCDDA